MVHIVPLGIDCILAEILKECQLRNISHPLDWVVSFGGIAQLFENKFEDFIPTIKYKYPNDEDFFWSEKYGIIFRHDDFPEKTETYNRRIQRLLDILGNTNEPILFLRNGHVKYHHDEVEHNNILYTDDLKDIIDFESAIKKHFPNLIYRIILFVRCTNCYLTDETYKVTSENIKVFNVSGCTNTKYDYYYIKQIIQQEFIEFNKN